MQCEHCKKRKATLFYKENMGGRIKEYQLCNDCAAALRQAGELEDMSILLESFTSPFSAGGDSSLLSWSQQSVKPATTGKSCPVCGCTAESIRASGRVGCENCYKTFAVELAAPIRAVHGRATHTGRFPRSYRQKREKQERVNALKTRLAAAISAEAYEQAAVIRDEIRALEGES